MNTQTKSKPFISPNGDLKINSVFQTIQGEGPFSGTPAVFVRLAGCNLQCPDCDTEYTKHDVWSAIDLLGEVNKIKTMGTRLVVITGGEPFNQNISPLIDLLIEDGLTVQIETNGVMPLPHNLVRYIEMRKLFIVCSPKTSNVHKTIMKHAEALKYVLNADDMNILDGLPTKVLGNKCRDMVSRPTEDFEGDIYLQPIDVNDPEENRRHMNQVLENCINYGYILCVQTHKIVGLE